MSKIKPWTLEDLEKMKKYNELDIYYEMLDLILLLEPHAENAVLQNKTSSKILRKEAMNLKFLASFLRIKSSHFLNGQKATPKPLLDMIEKEKTRRDNEEARYQARLKNLKKAAPKEDERIKNLKKAKEELKKRNEERRKEEEGQ